MDTFRNHNDQPGPAILQRQILVDTIVTPSGSACHLQVSPVSHKITASSHKARLRAYRFVSC